MYRSTYIIHHHISKYSKCVVGDVQWFHYSQLPSGRFRYSNLDRSMYVSYIIHHHISNVLQDVGLNLIHMDSSSFTKTRQGSHLTSRHMSAVVSPRWKASTEFVQRNPRSSCQLVCLPSRPGQAEMAGFFLRQMWKNTLHSQLMIIGFDSG